MARQLLIINGTDYTGYIDANGGYSISRNDVDDNSAGRTMDAKMQRGRIAVKYRLNIKCRPLTGAETQKILNDIYPEYVSVTYYDPRIGTRKNVEMYSNNVPAEYLFTKPDGTEWWRGISFPLIER